MNGLLSKLNDIYSKWIARDLIYNTYYLYQAVIYYKDKSKYPKIINYNYYYRFEKNTFLKWEVMDNKETYQIHNGILTPIDNIEEIKVNVLDRIKVYHINSITDMLCKYLTKEEIEEQNKKYEKYIKYIKEDK